MTSLPAPPPAPPHRVLVPVHVHLWDDIAFLHWPFESGALARTCPLG